MPRRKRPDHEAESVVIKADKIDEPRIMYRNKTHNGNYTNAKGNVSIFINRKHFESKDDDFRPGNGVVLEGDPDQKIRIEAKRIEKHSKISEGQQTGSASKDVRIFGKLRRRRS